jgi:hypothetical protein
MRVAGIGGSSRSCLYEKHDIVSFFLGKRSLLVLRMASCHAVLGSRDRRKLEELFPRKTQHPAVFSWQTQFAGAAVRIVRSSRAGSRDRRKLEEHEDFSTFWGMRCRRSWKETNP